VNERDSITRASEREALSRKQEAEFLAAASRVFRTGFPNPERSGCPSQRTLQVLIRQKHGAEAEKVFEHLTSCSPCFSDYEKLLHRERLSRNLKVLALCASILITIGVALWLYGRLGREGVRKSEPTIVQQPPPAKPAAPIQYQAAVVDLRYQSPVRGEQQPRSGDAVVATLPARPLDLSIYLPVGSEDGRYDLQIASGTEAPVVTLTGAAAFENRRVVMRLRTDLTGLAPGRYLLAIRKPDFRWSYYPIAVRP
jgi:hypothetical protein